MYHRMRDSACLESSLKLRKLTTDAATGLSSTCFAAWQLSHATKTGCLDMPHSSLPDLCLGMVGQQPCNQAIFAQYTQHLGTSSERPPWQCRCHVSQLCVQALLWQRSHLEQRRGQAASAPVSAEHMLGCLLHVLCSPDAAQLRGSNLQSKPHHKGVAAGCHLERDGRLAYRACAYVLSADPSYPLCGSKLRSHDGCATL